MAISFDLIPPNLRVPSVVAEFSTIRAQQGLTIQNFKALLVGQRISAQVRATGTLVLGGQPTDGDKFVISDGVTSVTFEFDSNASVVPSSVLRGVTIGATLADTLTNLQTAINAAPTFNVSAISITGGNTVNLRADLAGAAANVAITEPTNVSTFLSDTGMTGGLYTPTGTGTSLTPYRIGSAQEAANLWGAGSHLHRQAIAFFANNAFTEVWGIGFDDTLGSTVSTSGVSVSGPATGAGTLALYVGGTRYAITVASGDTSDAVCAAIATAINADTSAPFTASAVASLVTLTAKNAGIVANSIDVRHSHNPGESLPAGLGVTLTPFTGGGGGVDLVPVFAAVGEQWFNVIVTPYTGLTPMQAFAAELENRWGPFRAVDAFGVVSAVGDQAAAQAIAAQTNSGHLTVIPTNSSPTWQVEIAAAAGAVLAFYAAIDPARPFNGLPLIGVVAPLVRDRWTLSQRNANLFAGVSSTRVDDAGQVVLERVISTYRTNSVGAPDTAFLDATRHFSLSYIRYDSTTSFRTKYPRVKLASDETRLAAGQAVMTPGIARGEIIARAGVWESIGLIEDLDAFKTNLIVERDTNDPTRLNVQMAPNLVDPLIVVAERITFIL